VRDHGPGIDAVDRGRVFDRFYRSAAARSMPGSGLGLSIVKQVVDAHGGEVFAEPADGGGAVVGFELSNEDAASSR
jgi:two-component system sensor histidine kinase MprB